MTNLIQPSSGQERPHLTICATEVFTNLPLHAAGLYKSNIRECSLDYFVVLCMPTLGALLTAQRTGKPIEQTTAKITLATVPQPFDPWTKLMFATNETYEVRDVLATTGIPLASQTILTNPATANVLEYLPDTSILHLACHGYQDPVNPLESGFALRNRLLTVSILMQLKSPNAFLAYLSACDTAKGNNAQPDQAVHLVATMLFTGFQSVIGTMWQVQYWNYVTQRSHGIVDRSMGDIDGPVVARRFYEELFREGNEQLHPDDIPFALNAAVHELRTSGLHPSSRWAPYVHYGI
jgi:CHAT domain-containing protein